MEENFLTRGGRCFLKTRMFCFLFIVVAAFSRFGRVRKCKCSSSAESLPICYYHEVSVLQNKSMLWLIPTKNSTWVFFKKKGLFPS